MTSSRLKFFLTAVWLGFSSATLAAPTLVQDVRVFDGEHMHPKRSVLIDSGKIVNADFRASPPAGAIVINGAGKTLLPGLIDSHVHAYRHLDLPLLFGVTTQVDMFTGVQVMQDVSRKMQAGTNAAQADLFSAGTLVTAPGGHGTGYGMAIPTLNGPAEAQSFIDARIAEGSHFIKIVMEEGRPGHPLNTLTLASVKAAIDAAHRRGKVAVVHISNLADARAALQAGADGLVHLFAGATIAPTELAAFVQLAKASKAFVIPTFSVLESMARVTPDDILGDPELTGLLDREQMAPLKTSFGQVHAPALLAAPIAVTAALSKAKVAVLAGTDAGNSGTQYGISMHHELASLVKAGLSPVEALAAATSAPAKAFRLGQRGRIANGYKADLLLVDGDPGSDIGHTRRIVAVWKDGERADGLRHQQRARVAREATGTPPIALPADGRISLFSKEKLASPVGFGWGPTSDSMMGGTSSVALTVQDAEEGAQPALLVKAVVAPGFAYPWAGVAYMPGKAPMQPANLSRAKRLAFRVRGDGQAYSVQMMSHGVQIPVSVGFTAQNTWREVTLPISQFNGIDSGMMTMISFSAGPKTGTYQFELADVRLLND